MMPTTDNIRKWLTVTLQHAVHIEHYLHELQIGRSDIQRPHDLVGLGNKLEWPCIRGFSMQFSEEPGAFDAYVKHALDHHRQQHHHQAWNEFNPQSSCDAMRLGAVDAVCSLLEPRGYQGGVHTLDQIVGIAENNPIHKVAWMQLVALEMRKLKPVDPRAIEVDLKACNVTRLGLGIEMHERICDRINDVRVMLAQDHGLVIA